VAAIKDWWMGDNVFEKVGMCPQISRAALNDGFLRRHLLAISAKMGQTHQPPYFLKQMQELPSGKLT